MYWNITLVADIHGFPHFPVLQYSYIFYFLPGIFYFLVVVNHSTLYIPGKLYRPYWSIAVSYTPGAYIRGMYVQQYTWYPGIIRRMIFINRYQVYIRVFAKVRFSKYTSLKIVPKAAFAVHF